MKPELQQKQPQAENIAPILSSVLLDPKPITVKGVTERWHMAWAYQAVQDFKEWPLRVFKSEDGWSAAMKIEVGPRRIFRRSKATHEIFTFEKPDSYMVTIKPIGSNSVYTSTD